MMHNGKFRILFVRALHPWVLKDLFGIIVKEKSKE